VLQLLRVLQHGLWQEMGEGLRPHGITLIELGVLSAVKQRPGLSSADLARSRFVTPQSMNEVIAELAKAKLVTRRPHPDGGRILQVFLTPAGTERLDACQAVVRAVEMRMLRRLSASERSTLRDLLARASGAAHAPDLPARPRQAMGRRDS
jgi:DNA-binding MarR family transcriptional regulator